LTNFENFGFFENLENSRNLVFSKKTEILQKKCQKDEKS